MKRLLYLLLSSAVLAPAVLCAASFEGKVKFKITSGTAKSQEMSYSIKGDKMRVEMPSEKEAMGGVIMDMAKKEMTMIMDSQKMYMTMAIPDAATQAIGKKNADVTLEKTGETEKILGYTATKYISTHDGLKTDLWLAEGLGAFISVNANPMGGRRGGNSSRHAWEKALAGKDLFPLRVVGHDKSGKESSRMEVTAIDKQSLPESLFAPPAGYQKLDMGGMMKGMIPGAR